MTLFPSCSRLSVSVVDRCCASVLHTMNSTPLRLRAIILLTFRGRQEGGDEGGDDGGYEGGRVRVGRRERENGPKESREDPHDIRTLFRRPNSCSGHVYVCANHNIRMVCISVMETAK